MAMTRTQLTALTAAAAIGFGLAGASGVAAQDGQMVVIANDGVSQTSNAAGASNVVPVRPVRSEAQRDHGANKAQNGADRAARQANNSGGDGSAPAAPAAGYNAGGWDGQTGGSDAAPMDDYSGAPVEAAPSDAAGSGQGTVVVALPSTGIGDEAGYGAAVGLGALAAIAAAAAVAARRVRIAG